MGRLKKLLLIPVLGALLVASFGCNQESEEAELAETETLTATVQRGDIALEITAAGNLALSLTEDLTVDLFYGQSGATGTKGTIGEVLVDEGDIVTEGQVLVTVDRDEWADQMSALEDTVTSRERSLLDAQIALIQAEQSLKSAQDNQAAKELALLNAQISLTQAQDNLGDAVTSTDYDAALINLRKAKAYYDYVTSQAADMVLDADGKTALDRAEEALKEAQIAYDQAIYGYSTTDLTIKRNQVKAAEMSLAAAEEDLADVEKSIALAELQLTRKQGSVVDAEKALADAQEDLDEARGKSPEITAPFDGFITAVYVESGDEVVNGSLAVQIADPDKFEADIMVSEMDILQVALGSTAWVEVDAMSGMMLPAEVTHISPTATISSGVVNYTVKVEVLSLEAVAQERRAAMEEAIAAGELPPPLQAAVDAGELTQEEAEAIIAQGPPAGMGPPPGMEFPEGMEMPAAAGSAAAGQLPSIVPEDYQLREGLTVTVTIVVSESLDVLLVPYTAVTTEGEESYVQVVSASGEPEKRVIETGITDYQFTEVTDGLAEGEDIIVPPGTTVTTTSSSDRPRGPMFFGGPPPR